MKKILFPAVLLLLAACARDSGSAEPADAPEDSPFAETSGFEEEPSDLVNNSEDAFGELSAEEEFALNKENEDLKRRIEALNAAIESDKKENDKRFRAMEDLIALMEQTIRGLEETSAYENFDSTSDPSIQPLGTAGETLEPVSTDASAKDGLSGFSPSKEAVPVETLGGGREPFDAASGGSEAFVFSDFDDPVAPPASFPRLGRNPGAKDAYNRAYGVYQSKNYSQAIGEFQRLLNEFPEDQYTDNAVFWIGMAHFHLEEYDRAEEHYRRVLSNFKHGKTSDGFKTPDSIYMLGRVNEKLSDEPKARYFYSQVIEKYPDSISARNAEKKLRILDSDVP